MVRTLSILIALSIPACTFNVQTFEDTLEFRSTDGEAFTRLRADLTAASAPLDEAELVITGEAREDALAEIRIGGLLGAGESTDAISEGFAVDWPTGGDPVREMLISYDGPIAETLWIDRVDVRLPAGTELDLTLGSSSVDVRGLGARAVIAADSGSISLRDATEVLLQATSGSIDVQAETGTITCTSGSIDMALTGHVIASARSGSIRGTFGEGGELTADSGSIDVELLTELGDDLLLGADSGSITLVIPRGAAMHVETSTGSGSVDIDAGGVHHGGPDWSGDLNGGGTFTVRARTDSGSIQIVERGL